MVTSSPIASQPGVLQNQIPQSVQSVDASNIESVGTEFEAVFLSMMIKEMRNSLDQGFFGEEASDTYGGMFDMFIGQSLADSRPLGVAELMLQQYKKVEGADTSSEPSGQASNAAPTSTTSITA